MRIIELTNVTKRYKTRTGEKKVLDNINLTVKNKDKIGILGRNGAGKSTLIRLIGGIESPSAGTITRNKSISWPLAFGGGFQSSLSGLDNIKFICRIYQQDYKSKLQIIDDFSELGKYLREPIKNYSSGMLARLSFGISLAIDFDCILIDEVIAVGDDRFKKKCHEEIFIKRADKSLILVTHDMNILKMYCNKFAILSETKLKIYDDPDTAISLYLS